MGIPMYLEGAAGRYIYFMKHNFLSKIFHELLQLVVSKVSKSCLKMMQHFPAWGSLFRRLCGSSSPFEGFKHSVTRYTLVWVSEGAIALTVMASSHNSIAFTIPHVVHCNSSVKQCARAQSIRQHVDAR